MIFFLVLKRRDFDTWNELVYNYLILIKFISLFLNYLNWDSQKSIVKSYMEKNTTDMGDELLFQKDVKIFSTNEQPMIIRVGFNFPEYSKISRIHYGNNVEITGTAKDVETLFNKKK